jgi:hypothetical protein
MALSASAAAYGTVVVVGLVLFAIGTPAQRSSALAAEPATNAEPVSAYAAQVARTVEAQAAQAPAAAAPAVPTVEAAGIKLQSVSFDLPTDDQVFPGGAAAEVATNNCTACHSPGMVLTQPTLTRAVWQDEVNKMRSIYKAPVAEEDVPAIVAYIANLKGAK